MCAIIFLVISKSVLFICFSRKKKEKKTPTRKSLPYVSHISPRMSKTTKKPPVVAGTVRAATANTPHTNGSAKRKRPQSENDQETNKRAKPTIEEDFYLCEACSIVPSSAPKETWVVLKCKTATGMDTSVVVKGFENYVYVDASDACLVTERDINKVTSYEEQGLISTENVSAFPFKGYSKEPIPFLRLKFKNDAMRESLGEIGCIVQADVNIVRRFFAVSGVRLHDWFHLPASCMKPVTDPLKRVTRFHQNHEAPIGEYELAWDPVLDATAKAMPLTERGSPSLRYAALHVISVSAGDRAPVGKWTPGIATRRDITDEAQLKELYTKQVQTTDRTIGVLVRQVEVSSGGVGSFSENLFFHCISSQKNWRDAVPSKFHSDEEVTSIYCETEAEMAESVLRHIGDHVDVLVGWRMYSEGDSTGLRWLMDRLHVKRSSKHPKINPKPAEYRPGFCGKLNPGAVHGVTLKAMHDRVVGQGATKKHNANFFGIEMTKNPLPLVSVMDLFTYCNKFHPRKPITTLEAFYTRKKGGATSPVLSQESINNMVVSVLETKQSGCVQWIELIEHSRAKAEVLLSLAIEEGLVLGAMSLVKHYRATTLASVWERGNNYLIEYLIHHRIEQDARHANLLRIFPVESEEYKRSMREHKIPYKGGVIRFCADSLVSPSPSEPNADTTDRQHRSKQQTSQHQHQRQQSMAGEDEIEDVTEGDFRENVELPSSSLPSSCYRDEDMARWNPVIDIDLKGAYGGMVVDYNMCFTNLIPPGCELPANCEVYTEIDLAKEFDSGAMENVTVVMDNENGDDNVPPSTKPSCIVRYVHVVDGVEISTIFPRIFQSLIEDRRSTKEKLATINKTNTGSATEMALAALLSADESALKAIVASTYGCMAFEKNESMYCLLVASCITYLVRTTMSEIEWRVNHELQLSLDEQSSPVATVVDPNDLPCDFRVIYRNTDCLFLSFDTAWQIFHGIDEAVRPDFPTFVRQTALSLETVLRKMLVESFLYTGRFVLSNGQTAEVESVHLCTDFQIEQIFRCIIFFNNQAYAGRTLAGTSVLKSLWATNAGSASIHRKSLENVILAMFDLVERATGCGAYYRDGPMTPKSPVDLFKSQAFDVATSLSSESFTEDIISNQFESVALAVMRKCIDRMMVGMYEEHPTRKTALFSDFVESQRYTETQQAANKAKKNGASESAISSSPRNGFAKVSDMVRELDMDATQPLIEVGMHVEFVHVHDIDTLEKVNKKEMIIKRSHRKYKVLPQFVKRDQCVDVPHYATVFIDKMRPILRRFFDTIVCPGGDQDKERIWQHIKKGLDTMLTEARNKQYAWVMTQDRRIVKRSTSDHTKKPAATRSNQMAEKDTSIADIEDLYKMLASICLACAKNHANSDALINEYSTRCNNQTCAVYRNRRYISSFEGYSK